jgi:hypothetical protein
MTSKFQALQCHGLVPWMITVAATSSQKRKSFFNATGLPRGWLRSLLRMREKEVLLPSSVAASVKDHGASPWHRQGHGLAPWMVTFAATSDQDKRSFSPLVAASVKDHGASPWHPKGHGLAPWLVTFAATSGKGKILFLCAW